MRPWNFKAVGPTTPITKPDIKAPRHFVGLRNLAALGVWGWATKGVVVLSQLVRGAASRLRKAGLKPLIFA